MNIVGFIISIIFGGIWGRLFTQSCLSFCVAVASFVTVARGRSVGVNIGGGVLHLLTSLVCSGLIWALQYVAGWLGIGYSTIETAAFYIVGTLVIMGLIPQSLLRLKEVWKMSNDPAYLEEKSRSERGFVNL